MLVRLHPLWLPEGLRPFTLHPSRLYCSASISFFSFSDNNLLIFPPLPLNHPVVDPSTSATLAIRLLTGKTSVAPLPVNQCCTWVSQRAHVAPTHPDPTLIRHRKGGRRPQLWGHHCTAASLHCSYFSSIKNNWYLAPVKMLRGKPRLVIPAQFNKEDGEYHQNGVKVQNVFILYPLSLIQIGGQYLLWWWSLPLANFLKRISLYFGVGCCQLIAETTLKALFLPQYSFLP